MFLAPVLYVVHALFTGISMVIAALLPTRMGFGFSAGFIDMVLGWENPMAQNPWMLLVMGIVLVRRLLRRVPLRDPQAQA